MPNTEDLETFVAVADAGGVSPAARRLGLPKSIVSRRLVRLEAELGTQLLTRNTRGAALTEAGASFRQHAARVVAELDAAREEISPHGELRGLIRVAAPLSLGAARFAPLITEFALKHPQLQIHTAYSDRFVDLVTEGFDLALRMGYLQDSALIARRVGVVRARIVATPAYLATHGTPATLEELAGHSAIMQGTESWRLRDGEKIVLFHPQGRFKADNGQALVTAVMAGLGIAALPEFLIERELVSGELVPIMANYQIVEAGLFIVRPPGDHPPRKVRLLTEMLLERFSGMCEGGR